MNFSEFCKEFTPIKNTIDSSSLFGITFSSDNEIEEEIVSSKPKNRVWSVNIKNRTISSGIKYNENIVGYVITEKPYINNINVNV